MSLTMSISRDDLKSCFLITCFITASEGYRVQGTGFFIRIIFSWRRVLSNIPPERRRLLGGVVVASSRRSLKAGTPGCILRCARVALGEGAPPGKRSPIPRSSAGRRQATPPRLRGAVRSGGSFVLCMLVRGRGRGRGAWVVAVSLGLVVFGVAFVAAVLWW